MTDNIYEDMYRRFIPLGVERCLFCPGLAAAVWAVLEKDSGERIATCDRHKYTAFS